MTTGVARLPRYVDLHEVVDLEQVLDIPTLHLAELRRIPAPGREGSTVRLSPLNLATQPAWRPRR